MDRPDCLSLSYSAARLCYEDSKQMRTLHLLPHHALGKKNKLTYFKHSDGYLNIFSINPKRLLPKSCCWWCTQDEHCCSLLREGSKTAGAKGSLRSSWAPRWWAGTPTLWKARESCSIAWGTCYQCMMAMHPSIPGNLHRRASLRFPSQGKGPAPRPHLQQMARHPSGGWLGLNVPKSSQSLPPYCLPHWHLLQAHVWKTTENCKKQYIIKNHLKICCCYTLCSPTQKIPKYLP